MSEQVVETQAPAPTGKSSLADLLSGLDDAAREVILGEVSKARTEAKGLRDRLKQAEPQLTRLASLEAAQQTEAERQTAALNEATTRAEKAERDALRSSVALRKGLPANLAARLQGDDEASLEADADELLSLVPKNDGVTRIPRPDSSQGSSARGSTNAAPRDQFAAIMQQATGR
jgi:hypothetical protein